MARDAIDAELDPGERIRIRHRMADKAESEARAIRSELEHYGHCFTKQEITALKETAKALDAIAALDITA